MSQGVQGAEDGQFRDGRNIDPRLGTLSGEAAQQIAVGDRPASERDGQKHVFQTEPAGQKGLTTGDATYYDRPVIKQSVWSWTIPAYYYVGGATGASMALGAAATLLNREGLRGMVIQSRWIGVIGGSASAALLIYDLGKPSRFLNMLRVFRPTSPMSVGSWILVSFSSLSGVAAIAPLGPRFLQPLGEFAAILAGVLGLGLAGYTGVLVAQTAVPVWQRPHRLLPVLFLASATASAASLFDLLEGKESEHKTAAIFGVAGKAAELLTARAVERSVALVPEAARPLHDGFSGFVWKTGQVLSAVSLALSLLPGSARPLRRATGIIGTMGALCIRFGIHYAGQRSALNPRATFHQQRSGQGAFEITGQSAIAGPDGERAFEPRVSSRTTG